MNEKLLREVIRQEIKFTLLENALGSVGLSDDELKLVFNIHNHYEKGVTRVNKDNYKSIKLDFIEELLKQLLSDNKAAVKVKSKVKEILKKISNSNKK